MTHSFVLKGEPKSKKNGWASRAGGGFYNGTKGLKPYVAALQLQFKLQARAHGFEKIAAPHKVFIAYKIFFGKRQHAMDRHNAWETVLDALQGVCYDNDLQVVGDFHPPRRFVDESNPRVELEVSTALDAEQDPRWR